MSETIHRLASMKLAITLLVLIVLGMGAGTIIESIKGTEFALALVYHSAWFRVLLGLFALNVACSLIDRWPWSWSRAGFVMTHGAMLLVLAGAFVSEQFKTEGRMGLWEGDRATAIDLWEGTTHEIPFSVRLDDFEIEHYPGTRRPAQFRSRVTVEDPRTGESFPAVIQMNQELAYGGYKFFQSSYQQQNGREATILSVSKDPGQSIVFAGYVLLMIGNLTVIGTRVAQRRRQQQAQVPAPEKPRRRRVAAIFVVAALAGTIGATGTPAMAQSAWLPDAETTDALRMLPVQHDGRVMPLDTVAREACWHVTGEKQCNGIDPVALVVGWALEPQAWVEEPMIPLESAEMAAALQIVGGLRDVSFRELMNNPQMNNLVRRARALADKDEPLTPLLEEMLELEQRMVWMQRFLNQTVLKVVPRDADPKASWMQPPPVQDQQALLALLDGGGARHAATSPELLAMEVDYNRVRSSRLSWWILLAATGVSLLGLKLRGRWLDVLAIVGLFAGFVTMSWGLAVRWQIAGRIPASNMYESMLFLAWGVGLFALIALAVTKSRLIVLNAAAMATLTMMLVDLLPIDHFVHPMPPVLSGTPWLAIHVPIIMVSYSVLALGVLVAHVLVCIDAFAPAREKLAARLYDSLYWYIHIGAFLLIAGILTGSIWAASSWGRYWGWDPKEVWSLIAFLIYLAILHGKLDNVIGRFGVALASIVAFWTVLMTYLGVNFVLAAGLHSYGFGGSAVVRWMVLVAVAETLLLSTAWLARRGRLQRGVPQQA